MIISFRLPTALLAAVFVSAGSIHLFAQDAPPPSRAPAPPPPADRPRPGPPPRSLVFEVLDTNHDGVISADELANAAESLKRLDTNGDGQLTRDELRPPRDENDPALDRTRTDGHLGGDPHQPFPPSDAPSADGRPPGPPKRFQRPPKVSGPPADESVNSDDSGRRAPDFAKAQRPPPPRLADDPVVNRLDAAQGERAASPPPVRLPPPLFYLLDANHDGKLSEEEINNAPTVLRKLNQAEAGSNRSDDPRPQPPQPPAN